MIIKQFHALVTYLFLYSENIPLLNNSVGLMLSHNLAEVERIIQNITPDLKLQLRLDSGTQNNLKIGTLSRLQSQFLHTKNTTKSTETPSASKYAKIIKLDSKFAGQSIYHILDISEFHSKTNRLLYRLEKKGVFLESTDIISKYPPYHLINKQTDLINPNNLSTNHYLFQKQKIHPKMTFRKKCQTLLNSGINTHGVVSACQFNKNGSMLAVSDLQGYLCLYKKNQQNNIEFVGQFCAQEKNLQKVTEKILSVRWLDEDNQQSNLLTVSGSCVKIWKISILEQRYELQLSKYFKQNHKNYFLPFIQGDMRNQIQLICDSVDVNFSKDLILSQNGQTVTVTDIFYSKPISQFVSIPIQKPPCIPQFRKETKADYQQRNYYQNEYWNSINTVTNAKFQAYSDKAGLINFIDIRQKKNNSVSLKFGVPKANTLVECCLNVISDFQFLEDGYSVISRDFLYVYKWDMRYIQSYLMRKSVYPSINSQICQLYQQGQIFNRFQLKCNSSGSRIFTTGFEQSFHQFDSQLSSNIRYTQEMEEVVKGINYNIAPVSESNVLESFDYNQNQDVACVAYGSTLKFFSHF